MTEGTSPVAISANLDKVLDKAYESSSLAELVDAPVSALAGVSEANAEALKKAFNIKTIGDLAGNKYVRAATAIVEIASITK
jgi:predicted metalloprotease with PDZ domain